MNRMNKLIFTLFLTLLFSASACSARSAQNDLLSRVPQLQETARQANGGALGDGFGSYTLVTSYGEIKVDGGLDPINVFGERIVVADLLTLLEARVEANRTGNQNPMSGDVSDLAYVILSTLAESKDPTVIPVITKLLDDKDDTIRGWSVIALLKLAESDEDLQKEIKKVTFPKAAVSSAEGRGVKLPTWAKTDN